MQGLQIWAEMALVKFCETMKLLQNFSILIIENSWPSFKSKQVPAILLEGPQHQVLLFFAAVLTSVEEPAQVSLPFQHIARDANLSK